MRYSLFLYSMVPERRLCYLLCSYFYKDEAHQYDIHQGQEFQKNRCHSDGRSKTNDRATWQ